MKFLLILFIVFTAMLPSLRAQNKDTGAIAQRTLAAFRDKSSAPFNNKTYYITDPGKEGLFMIDPADKTSPDDSVMTLVTAAGLRLKRTTEQGVLNVRWFGATGNGGTDDWYAIQKAIDYILNNNSSGRTLYFPAGNYKISKPLLIARLTGATYQHSAITLMGPANSKILAAGYARITTAFNNSFAIGIQIGKGVLIKDLVIMGQFNLPHSLNPIQVDTLSFNEWTDHSARENPVSPYAGVVIDPFSDSNVYAKNTDMYPGLHRYCPAGIHRGGSSNVQIVGCSIQNFIVGVMITPSNQQNAELIDVIDCDISYNKVAYAMGQAQSKECHVDRLKCWGATHTVFDNTNFGFRHGDGANCPLVDGVNIAGHVKQLCNIHTNSFSGVFRNVYAEGLFRLGYVGGAATVSFEDCQIDFSTLESGLPYPDFYVLGSGAAFHDCMLRLYPGVPGARLILSGTNNHYDGGTTNAPPIAVNLDNNGIYPNPSFSNMVMYYSGGILGSNNYTAVSKSSPMKGSNGFGTDPVYYGNTYFFRDPADGTNLMYKFTYQSTYERTLFLAGPTPIHTDKTKWTAWFKLARLSDTTRLRPGDFILATGLHYLDEYTVLPAPTYPVGIIQYISHDTVHLANLAVGINEGMSLYLWMDYFVNATTPLTGDMAAGSNTFTKVQGTFPNVGERLDMPMLLPGSYVTAIDPAAKTIRFSNANNTGKDFPDYTCINGYPTVEMYGHYDLPYLQQAHKTLLGGADYYWSGINDENNYGRDDLINNTWLSHAKILNSNFQGDTSLHKLKYLNLSASGPGEAPTHAGTGRPLVLSSAPGATIKIEGNDINMKVTIVTTAAATTGSIARIGFSRPWAAIPVAVLSYADANTASHAAGMFCNAGSSSELTIGGNLPGKGTYVFNIHVGQ